MLEVLQFQTSTCSFFDFECGIMLRLFVREYDVILLTMDQILHRLAFLERLANSPGAHCGYGICLDDP